MKTRPTPAPLIRGAVYSKSQLDAIFGRNSRRFAAWKKAGLRPLGTGTREEYFLSDDLFAVWKKLRPS
jgi:hypothetical protein